MRVDREGSTMNRVEEQQHTAVDASALSVTHSSCLDGLYNLRQTDLCVVELNQAISTVTRPSVEIECHT